MSNLRIAINVSGRQFNEPGFDRTVSRVLDVSGFDPRCLDLEITESVVLENTTESLDTLLRLKRLGVRLSIDDFGTGYSSLACLRQFPIDALKIDRSFLRGVPDDSDHVALTSTILAMAQMLQLDVVAEGVESESQRQFLLERGCQEMQGFLVSRPVPAVEFEQFAFQRSS